MVHLQTGKDDQSGEWHFSCEKTVHPVLLSPETTKAKGKILLEEIINVTPAANSLVADLDCLQLGASLETVVGESHTNMVSTLLLPSEPTSLVPSLPTTCCSG